MTVTTPAQPVGFPAWAARRGLWFLIAVHLPFIVITPLVTMTRVPGAAAGR